MEDIIPPYTDFEGTLAKRVQYFNYEPPPTKPVPARKPAGHPRFYEILDEIRSLHDAKNGEYATPEDPLASFKRAGKLISKLLKPSVDPTLAACLALMSKQVDGIYEIVGEGKTQTVEGLRDKLRDTAVYSIIALVILEEGNPG